MTDKWYHKIMKFVIRKLRSFFFFLFLFPGQVFLALFILKIWLCKFVTPLVAISDAERTREDLFLLRLFYVETGTLFEYIRIRRRFGGKMTAGVCLEVDRRLHGVSTCDNQTGQAGSRQGIEESILIGPGKSAQSTCS